LVVLAARRWSSHFTMLVAFRFPDFLADGRPARPPFWSGWGGGAGQPAHRRAAVAMALGVVVSFVGVPAGGAGGGDLGPWCFLLINFRRMLRGDQSTIRVTLLACYLRLDRLLRGLQLLGAGLVTGGAASVLGRASP
jgi:hypothetical protein